MHRHKEHRCSSPNLIENKTFIVKDFPSDMTFEVDSLLLQSFGCSTKSLLAPTYANDCQSLENLKLSDNEKESILDEKNKRSDNGNGSKSRESYSQSDSGTSFLLKKSSSNLEVSKSLLQSTTNPSTSSQKSQLKTSPQKSQLKISSADLPCSESNSLKKKSWDDWLLNKAIIDLKKMELKKERRNKLLIEKKKLFDEKRQKAELAKKVREEWIKQKTFLIEKKKREAAAQEEFERLKSAQKKEIVHQRSKESFSKWLEEKSTRDRQKKKQEERAQRQAEDEKMNKCMQSDIVYKNWLSKAKKKNLHSRFSYGYLDGSLFTYYDMTSTPTPSFTNPMPWVDTNYEKEKTDFYCSPPMLWKDVEVRQQSKINIPAKSRTNVVKKHSCLKAS